MTGPEHFREAERLIEPVADPGRVLHMQRAPAPDTLALAQVHATLALAAATALNDHSPGMPQGDLEAWSAAAATTPEGGTA